MKILLMPNFEGWAFDRIAQGIKKYGSHDYEIKYEVDYRKYRGRELPNLDFNAYDRIILFAPWMDWTNLPWDKTICICHEAFEIDSWNTTKYYKVFVTSDISLDYIKHKDNVLKVQTGIDFDDFFQEYPCDFSYPVVVGWVGAISGHKGKKGFNDFYLPLDEWFHLYPHVKEADYIEPGEYPSFIRKYYSKIDVLICTSSWEGYPLSILEASACGVPVVSTKVGVAPEILPEKNLTERKVESIRDTISNCGLYPADVSKWDWKLRIKEWEDAIL